jgi:hypothetical protein
VARYGQAFKDKAVARLLPPESADLAVVSREMGVSVATLERWRASGSMPFCVETLRVMSAWLARTGWPAGA